MLDEHTGHGLVVVADEVETNVGGPSKGDRIFEAVAGVVGEDEASRLLENYEEERAAFDARAGEAGR